MIAVDPAYQAVCLWQCFGPLALFHVEGREAIEERATSIMNVAEASMVLSLYMELRARYSHLSSSNQIAVISPYKAQVLPRLIPCRRCTFRSPAAELSLSGFKEHIQLQLLNSFHQIAVIFREKAQVLPLLKEPALAIHL